MLFFKVGHENKPILLRTCFFLDEFPLPDSSSVSDIFVFLDLQYAMMRIMLAVKNNIPVTSRDTAIIM